MSEMRGITEAPRLAPETRQQMLGALYDAAYAQTMPREQFDAQVGGKSDYDIANATYGQFYDGRLSRQEFNKRVGLTSAQGSTRAAIMQGVSLGFADEVGAGAEALVAGTAGLLRGRGLSDFAPAYNSAMEAQRQNLEVFRQNNPYVGTGLEVGGGLTGAGAGRGLFNAVRGAEPATTTARAIAAEGLAAPAGARVAAAEAPTMARNVATSAGMGAVGGFGQGDTIEDRAIGAATGGALGGAMATALPAVLRLGQGVVGRVAQAVGLGDNEEVATRMLLRAMQDDGLTPGQAMARLNEWRTSGAKPEALFDIGGESTRRLARTAAGRVGPGNQRAVEFVTERQAGQAGRISDDAAAGLGQSADDFFARRQSLLETRRSAAAPRYEAAFRRVVPTADEAARVERFVHDPIGQDALQRGLRVIELEHLARNEPFNPAALGVVRGEDGRFVLQDGFRNMRLMDAVKRGFDDIVEGFRDGTSGRLNLDQYGNAVNDARAAYVRELREMFPRYGSALDAWSGPTQSMDAMARGRNVFSMRDAEAAAAAVSVRKNPAEQEFFRLGVAQAIQEKIASAPDGADAVKRIFGSPAKRALLRAAFPDEASFNQFAARMQREAAMYRNGQFVSPRTGSQTELRQSEADTFSAGLGEAMAGTIMPGRSLLGALAGFGASRLAAARGVTPEVADALTQRLFTAETPEMVAALRDLGQRRIRQGVEEEAAKRLRGAALPRLTAGATAGLE